MSEYLSEEEQIARMKSWWDTNGTSVIVAVVVGVVAIVGWRWYGGYTVEQAEEAARSYAAYQTADEADKVAAAARLATEHGGSAYHAFVLFDQARTALADGEPAAAESHLVEIVDGAADPLLTDLARIRLAKVQQQLDRSSEALATLDGLRSEGYRSWALEAKGDIHMARDEVQQAHEAYQAASDSLLEGEVRPILEMKLNNAAPYGEQYVELTDSLESALRDAEQTLADVESTEVPAEPERSEGDEAGDSDEE